MSTVFEKESFDTKRSRNSRESSEAVKTFLYSKRLPAVYPRVKFVIAFGRYRHWRCLFYYYFFSHWEHYFSLCKFFNTETNGSAMTTKPLYLSRLPATHGAPSRDVIYWPSTLAYGQRTFSILTLFYEYRDSLLPLFFSFFLIFLKSLPEIWNIWSWDTFGIMFFSSPLIKVQWLPFAFPLLDIT